MINLKNNKIDRILAYGCSLTAGQGLNDPNKAWVNLLSRKLNIEVINYGIPGASNKKIWKRILDTDFKTNDAVIVQWSYTSRFCFFNKDNDIDILNAMIYQDETSKDKKKFLTKFYTEYYSYYDAAIELLNRANYINYYLKEKNIPVIHNQIYVLEEYDELKTQNWNNVDILNLFDVDELKHKYPLAADNMHPGEKSNEIISELYYNEILKRKWI